MKQMSKQLSQREKQVIELASNGDTSKDIAKALFISPRTVDSHVASIRRKMSAKNITHAVRLAIENGDINLTSTAVNYILEKMKLTKPFLDALYEHCDHGTTEAPVSVMWKKED